MGGGGVGNEKAPVDGSVKISWGRAVEGGETRRSRSGSAGWNGSMLAILSWWSSLRLGGRDTQVNIRGSRAEERHAWWWSSRGVRSSAQE